MLPDGDGTAGQSAAHDDGPGDPGDEPPSSRSSQAPAPARRQDAVRAPDPGADAGSAVEVRADPGVRPAGATNADLDAIAAGIADRLRQVIAILDVPVDRLAVRLVGDPVMAGLHRRHCGLDATTDVLSFPASEPGEPVDADIACCVDEAARQAGRRGHPVADELLLYAVHGLLHCLGHDDHEPEAYAAMHAEEDRILAAIGVGARFASAERDDAEADPATAASRLESPGVDS